MCGRLRIIFQRLITSINKTITTRPSFTWTGGMTQTTTTRYCLRWGLYTTSNREVVLSITASLPSRVTKIFDEEYNQREMIEYIFGGEESKHHQLHCRFIQPDNRHRFDKIRVIIWNIKVLNRLRSVRIRGIKMPSYGMVSCL